MRTRAILLAILCMILACCLFVGCETMPDTTGSEKLQISITNKTELTAKWTVGDADRTLTVALSPESYTTENTNVIVSTSDADVIAADGMKLTAKSAGTATITVSAGTAVDTVEITVTPALASVSIANKAELGEAWMVGEADREMRLVFSPDYYNGDNAGVQITSDAPDIVSVSGTTLVAVSEGTATITVTAQGKTDSVEIRVTPALDSISVTNKTELEGVWTVGTTRTILPAFTPDSYTAESTIPEITCTPAGLIEADGWNIKAVGVGTGTVTVTVRGKSDTFTVTTEHAAPEIFFGGDGFSETEDGYEMSAMQDTPMILPKVTAKNADGSTVEVTIDYENRGKLHIDGTTVTPDIGVHTVTYTAVNPADATKVTRKVLTIRVYRKIFGYHDGTYTVTNERVPNAEQTVTTSNDGYSYARFNMAPSKYYYASVTFKSTATSGVWIGLANMFAESIDRMAVSAMTLGDTNCNSGEFRTTGDNAWNITSVKSGYPLFQSWQISGYRGIPVNTTGEITYTTVRDGDFIFYFVNGYYVHGFSLKDYRDADTVPGIFGSKMNSAVMSNIEYCSGAEARGKIDTLLAGGSNVISQFLIYTENRAADANTYGENENRFFRVGEVSEERGLHFDFTDKTVQSSVRSYVSPYLWFDGDFTFEFDYKATDWNRTDGNQHRMYIRLRNWYSYGSDRKDILWFGAQVASGSEDTKVLSKEKAYRSEVSDWAGYTSEDGTNFDAADGLHFKVTRRLYDDYAEYTLTVSSLSDPTRSCTRTVRYSASDDAAWNEPVQIYWENQQLAGEYSHISWNIERFSDTAAE